MDPSSTPQASSPTRCTAKEAEGPLEQGCGLSIGVAAGPPCGPPEGDPRPASNLESSGSGRDLSLTWPRLPTKARWRQTPPLATQTRSEGPHPHSPRGCSPTARPGAPPPPWRTTVPTPRNRRAVSPEIAPRGVSPQVCRGETKLISGEGRQDLGDSAGQNCYPLASCGGVTQFSPW